MIRNQWVFICVVILLVIGVSGCMGRQSYSEIRGGMQEEALAGMREHLLERYGEFEYVANPVVMRELTRPSTDECYMYIQRGETEEERDEFRVDRYGNEEDGYYYEDNYYWHVIRDEYEAQMKEELSELFPGCKAFLAIGSLTYMLPDEITGETSLQEAKEIGLPNHMFWVIVDPNSMSLEEFEALTQAVNERWVHKDTGITLRIFYPNSNGIYSTVNRYNYISLLDQYVAEIEND